MSNPTPLHAETPPDPFDLEGLRVRQDFTETAGVKKLLTTVPVRKPSPQDFVRVSPDPAHRETLHLIEIKDDRESFLVHPEAAGGLVGETVIKTLYVAINRQGVVFFWPVTLPGPDGRTMEWHRSAAEAAELAMIQWVPLRANMSLGAYEMFVAEGVIADPVCQSCRIRNFCASLLRISS
jgi:hypothetical protein